MGLKASDRPIGTSKNSIPDDAFTSNSTDIITSPYTARLKCMIFQNDWLQGELNENYRVYTMAMSSLLSTGTFKIQYSHSTLKLTTFNEDEKDVFIGDSKSNGYKYPFDLLSTITTCNKDYL